LLLVAAAPPTPAPLITPTSSPPPPPITPPPANQIPSVLIYPFDVESGEDPKIGTAISSILRQEMTTAGGVDVLTLPTGVARPKFLEYARAQHADFYIAGFVTPVGEGAAVVDQVVSVESGVIVFSNTVQVVSVADVAAQALQQRAAIFALIGRGAETISAQPTETPAPTSSNGANVPLNGIASIVDSVFGAKHKPGASPSPIAIVKPPRGVIVAPAAASGTVSAADLTSATNELTLGLSHFYTVKTTAAVPNVAKAADAICGTSRDNTVASGILSQSTAHHRTQYAFTLQVYTCFGALLDGENGTGNTIKKAVDAAIAAYATAHPDNS
jgi:hypothetical protein